MTRRFSKSDRVALYLAADGKCSECGCQLEAGWHADHETPFSKGGPTDVVNGRALCPACNLKKGSRGMYDWPLSGPQRVWQREAVSKFDNTDGDFLAVAAPGAGKTAFALDAARRVGATHVVIVCPTSHLRQQWADVADRFGFTLDPEFENGKSVMSKDKDGVVVTYQGVSSSPGLYRRLFQNAFVILDEIHHCGEADHLRWGEDIDYAFEFAKRRLLLSGTPFREDNTPIPFVRYEGSPLRSVADYAYSYGRAMSDGVVRAISFRAFDGAARWLDAGDIISKNLSEVTTVDTGRALASALKHDGEWIQSVMREAVAELDRVRLTEPNAGGLVIASRQEDARQYRKILAQIIGREPALALSDDVNASKVIDAFSRSSDPWLVAVKMVSEGVDIPRLTVGVYASNTRTETFFRQVVGRFVRLPESDSDTCATLFIPSVQSLLELAKKIEDESDKALKEIVERARATEPITLDLVEPLPADGASPHSTILSGEIFDDAELRHAYDLAEKAGLRHLSAAQAAHFLRLAGGVKVGEVKIPAPERPQWRQKRDVQKALTPKVRRYASRADVDFNQVWIDLNRAVGEVSVKAATLESLLDRHRVIDAWTEGL